MALAPGLAVARASPGLAVALASPGLAVALAFPALAVALASPALAVARASPGLAVIPASPCLAGALAALDRTLARTEASSEKAVTYPAGKKKPGDRVSKKFMVVPSLRP